MRRFIHHGAQRAEEHAILPQSCGFLASFLTPVAWRQENLDAQHSCTRFDVIWMLCIHCHYCVAK
jgi:hypothetical protein